MFYVRVSYVYDISYYMIHIPYMIHENDIGRISKLNCLLPINAIYEERMGDPNEVDQKSSGKHFMEADYSQTLAIHPDQVILSKV